MIADAAITAVQVGIIAAQKFAEGGPIYGQSHARGGVPIEAEGGEYMINRRSTSKHLDLIRAINENDQLGIANAALQNGAFHDVWAKRDKTEISVYKDPWTKKMYELMLNTPDIIVQENQRIEKYPGRTRIIKNG